MPGIQYPSDISKEQYIQVAHLLESHKKKTYTRTYDLYDIFCATIYVVHSGCQWRMLPSDYPKWQAVYSYFRMWSKSEDGQPILLEQALKKCSV